MSDVLAVLAIIIYLWAIFALDPRIRKRKLSAEYKRHVEAKSKKVAKFLSKQRRIP